MQLNTEKKKNVINVVEVLNSKDCSDFDFSINTTGISQM